MLTWVAVIVAKTVRIEADVAGAVIVGVGDALGLREGGRREGRKEGGRNDKEKGRYHNYA